MDDLGCHSQSFQVTTPFIFAGWGMWGVCLVGHFVRQGWSGAPPLKPFFCCPMMMFLGWDMCRHASLDILLSSVSFGQRSSQSSPLGMVWHWRGVIFCLNIVILLLCHFCLYFMLIMLCGPKSPITYIKINSRIILTNKNKHACCKYNHN